MWRLSGVVLFGALTSSLACAQQGNPSAPSEEADKHAPTVKVYSVGAPGVAAPRLLPPEPLAISDRKCRKERHEDTVVLTLIVDSTGEPRNIAFIHPLGSDLDKLALQAINTDRFTPGSRNGAPAAVWQSVEVTLQSCAEKVKDADGKKAVRSRLIVQPMQTFSPLPQAPEEAVYALGTYTATGFKSSLSHIEHVTHVGGRVSAPVPLIFSEAEFTPEARKKRISGVCLVSLIVDPQGMPQGARIIRSLEPGLDQKALEAANKYRFKPAMRNGIEPVPAVITIEVNFRLY